MVKLITGEEHISNGNRYSGGSNNSQNVAWKVKVGFLRGLCGILMQFNKI